MCNMVNSRGKKAEEGGKRYKDDQGHAGRIYITHSYISSTTIVIMSL